MKRFLLLFALLSLVFTQIKFPDDQEIKIDESSHGCVIPEGQHKCCWVNNNGCCAPGFNQICTQAITTCCKMRVYDEETGTYKYEYSHHY